MTAIAAINRSSISIDRADPSTPVLIATGRDTIAIRAGTVIRIDGRARAFDTDTPIPLGDLDPGTDYGVGLDAQGKPFASGIAGPGSLDIGWFGGFHFAPGGNAATRDGGDRTPAINPHSLWDLDFRPACPDPRGMALVEASGGRRFWADIYLLGIDHREQGTSRHGATIADGRDLPDAPDGGGRVKKLDYATAVAIYKHHGKQLLGAEEFFAAAYGVRERCSRDEEPILTGSLDDGAERFISKWGLFDITGTMWQWGADGDPDNPLPSLFGGSWLLGSRAGSRYADLVSWPGNSSGNLSARGLSDHMIPA